MNILTHTINFLILKKKEFDFPFASYQKKNNCIFIHIPKVAGTSILRMLGKKSGGRNHFPWYVYYSANPVYFKKAFKFAFVRNPWDRVYSSYSYLLSGGNQIDDVKLSKLLHTYSGFDDFVVRGLGKGFLRNHLLFLPQSFFILGPMGQSVVDFIGRFENIDKDYRFISEKLNLSNKLHKINATQTKKTYFKDAYKQEQSVKIIETLYLQDVVEFNYQFD